MAENEKGTDYLSWGMLGCGCFAALVVIIGAVFIVIYGKANLWAAPKFNSASLSQTIGQGVSAFTGGTSPQPAISQNASEDGRKVIEMARSQGGQVLGDCCWTSCTRIYSDSGMNYQAVYLRGQVIERSTPEPGDILQIPASESPTGEHNVIFDHATEDGKWVVWNAAGYNKPWEIMQPYYDPATEGNPTIIWKPVPK